MTLQNDSEQLHRAVKRMTCKINRLVTPALERFNETLYSLGTLGKKEEKGDLSE